MTEMTLTGDPSKKLKTEIACQGDIVRTETGRNKKLKGCQNKTCIVGMKSWASTEKGLRIANDDFKPIYYYAGLCK